MQHRDKNKREDRVRKQHSHTGLRGNVGGTSRVGAVEQLLACAAGRTRTFEADVFGGTTEARSLPYSCRNETMKNMYGDVSKLLQ